MCTAASKLAVQIVLLFGQVDWAGFWGGWVSNEGILDFPRFVAGPSR